MGTKITKIEYLVTQRTLCYHLEKTLREYLPGGHYSRAPGHWFAARFQPCVNGIPVGPNAKWVVFDSEAECDDWIKHQRRHAS